MIFLIGFPGNNQKEIANKLAEEIGYETIDLEDLFVHTYNKTISEMYNAIGIHSLYGLIRTALNAYIKISGEEYYLISTVQGIPITKDFIEYMKSLGQIWYVKNDNWYINIKDNYKDFMFFKDISDDEYISACKYLNKEFSKKCSEIKDFVITD